jgi:hypothetical protein
MFSEPRPVTEFDRHDVIRQLLFQVRELRFRLV